MLLGIGGGQVVIELFDVDGKKHKSEGQRKQKGNEIDLPLSHPIPFLSLVLSKVG